MSQFMPLFTLRKYSHFFKVMCPTPRVLGLLFQFCSIYSQRAYVREAGRRPTYKVVRVFAARTKNNSEFRFHIGQLAEFKELLRRNYITPDLYEETSENMYVPAKIRAKLKPGWVLKDFQEAVGDHIANKLIENHSRLVSLPTGTGKTVSALASVAKTGSRVAIVILPQYIDKWSGDILNILDVKPKDIMTVQGSNQLKGIIALAKEGGLTSSFIIISVKTIQNFYKLYELDPNGIEEAGYDCMPEDLFKTLGIGNVIIDETHQHIHAVFKFMLYTHVEELIALSATLLTEDPIISNVHNAMYPKETRYEDVKMSKYIKLYPVEYRYANFDAANVRTTEYGSTSYSHGAYEKSILKSVRTRKSYYNMIRELVMTAYIDNYLKGDKLVIFAASIAMCTDLTNYLKEHFSQYDIRRYVEDDPYVNVIDADIRVTTPLSGGTAIDIPNLRAAIMTVNISSPVSNIQSLGRLRLLADRDVKFYYLYCSQIPKHVEYHQRRLGLFIERVATIKDYKYDKLL